MKKTYFYIFIVILLIFLDQITKYIIQTNFYLGESIPVIQGFFSITYVQNTGAAFGIFADSSNFIRQLVLILVPVVAVIWLVALIIKSKSRLLSWSYTLILAGAIGNLIDRIFLSFVVDFLDFYYKDMHFPAFNVADSCITIAAGLLIIDFLYEIFLKKKKKS